MRVKQGLIYRKLQQKNGYVSRLRRIMEYYGIWSFVIYVCLFVCSGCIFISVEVVAIAASIAHIQ